MKEKLIITCEIDELPADTQILDFNLTVIENGAHARKWKNWLKIKYIRLPITKMEVQKINN